MDILLERYTLPKKGVFEIDLHQAIDIRVTAEEAQHQVNRWLLENVSYMMYADPPTLVIGERAVWRVPGCLYVISGRTSRDCWAYRCEYSEWVYG